MSWKRKFSKYLLKCCTYNNTSREEWQAISGLAGDSNIVIKKVDKSACVVIWESADYFLEVVKQFKERPHVELAKKSKKKTWIRSRRCFIGKGLIFYILAQKVHKRRKTLFADSSIYRFMMELLLYLESESCLTVKLPQGKASVFFQFHLKLLMQEG